MDPGQNPISVFLLAIEFETLAPFWAISDAPTHMISIPTWRTLVVFDYI
jgi:hypothetical protein